MTRIDHMEYEKCDECRHYGGFGSWPTYPRRKNEVAMGNGCEIEDFKIDIVDNLDTDGFPIWCPLPKL